jgi:DNA-binding NarL/FixJ family response regulator
MSIRVLLADDQELVRTGFRLILQEEPDITVAGEAATGEEAVLLGRELRPDVILMDIRMPRLDGIAATRQLLAEDGAPQPKIIILTTFDLDEYVYDALVAGASGFLLKDVRADQLIAGIRTAATGEALLSPAITQRLITRFVERPLATPAPPGIHDLTQRETEILVLIASGLSNTEIGAELHIGEATVKTHITHLLMKLGLRDRVQAVVLAYETGIVQPGHTRASRDRPRPGRADAQP